jgi:hypothetical protein
MCRLSPNAACNGSRNRLNVYGTMGAKLVITPMNAAVATPHPGYRKVLSLSISTALVSSMGRGFLTMLRWLLAAVSSLRHALAQSLKRFFRNHLHTIAGNKAVVEVE